MARVVSAIIPTFNRAELLARALRSLIAQDHRPLEAVIIDDGSTDHTPQVVQSYRPRLAAAQVKLIFHQQPNGRAPRARNVGMKLATGSLLAFLDSDDLWMPQFASTLSRLLERYPSAGLAFSGINVIDQHDQVWTTRESRMNPQPKAGMPSTPEGVLHRPFHMILDWMPLQTSGVMVRRSVIDDIGDFDLELPVVEDWDLWYRIGRKYDFAFTLRNLACNRMHPRNLPKYDLTALSSSIRMNLKHLPDVADPPTRQMLIERIERQFTLYQEELLREGKASNGKASNPGIPGLEPHSHLLRHELTPHTPRFALGSMISQGPGWVGRSYGWLVRVLGELKRGTPT